MPAIDSNVLHGTRLLEALQLPAQTTSINQVVMIAAKHAASLGLPPERVSEVELAVEEVMANVCMYAYSEEGGDVEVSFFVGHAPVKLAVVVMDSGKPFNILDVPEPDLTSDLDDRPVGGLGAFLVCAVADHVEYERLMDRNIVRLMFSPTDD